MEALATAGTFITENAGTIGAVTQGVGLIGQVVGGVQANNYNATVTKQKAAAAQQRFDIEERQIRARARQDLGKAENLIGASGLSGSSGTPLDLLIESAYRGELNAMNARNGGQLESTTLKNQASLYKSRNFGTIFGGLGEAGGIISRFL